MTRGLSYPDAYRARAFGRLAADLYGERRRITCPSEKAWLRLAIVAMTADMIRRREI